jgi:3-isopropylmalate/(R)-2-methylmalate dehydratase large subunit
MGPQARRTKVTTMQVPPQTLAEKIVANAAGRDSVRPGEIVTCRVDLAMVHDSSGPRRLQPMLERLGAGIRDPARLVIITDHYVPVFDEETREIKELTRRFAQEHAVGGYYEEEGICHVVLPERGHLRPGMFVVGGDSHSPTGGAFGAYMFGVGATEMAGVVATGEVWLRVPESIMIEWTGRLQPGVMAKDMMLFLCGRLGMGGGRYAAVEYAGDAVSALSIQERMTLANMTAELGGQTGLVAPDEVTAKAVQAAGSDPGDWRRWRSDAGAVYDERHSFAAASLSPQVAAPFSPANAAPAAEYRDVAVNVAYIGACTGAKLDDLRMAASILTGRRVASGVQLLVAPASRREQERARAEGILAALEDAGARMLPNTCGICAGYGPDRLGDEDVCISSTARNFKGRMGSAASRVYLASPLTVAASAVAGRVVDPREMMGAPR